MQIDLIENNVDLIIVCMYLILPLLLQGVLIDCKESDEDIYDILTHIDILYSVTYKKVTEYNLYIYINK